MPIPEQVIRWIRFELDDAEFERWVYANDELLTQALGPERAFELLEMDYRPEDINKPSAKDEMRLRLIGDLSAACRCILMLDRQALPLGIRTRATADSPFYNAFTRIKGGPQGSEMWTCKSCSQNWFVNVDMWDDLWYFERMSTEQARAVMEKKRWPGTYDEFGKRWPSGHSAWRTTATARTFNPGFGPDFLFPPD